MYGDLPILDRVPHFDERSRQFPIRKLLATTPVAKRQRIWTPRSEGPLDQGSEGRCVVFGWGGELAATPQRHSISNDWCNGAWSVVQTEDRRMGNTWEDGASVLAGAKAMRSLNKIRYYAWAFGVQDVINAIMLRGPVILGINWYESMYDTKLDGLVTVSGRLVGGHCIMVNGYIPNHPSFGECVIWTNSWGRDYGVNGRGYVKISDLDRLLKEDGEACIPTDMPVRL